MKAIYCEPSTIASRIVFNAEMELKKYKLVLFGNQFLQICMDAKQNTLSHFLGYIIDFISQFPDEKFSQFSVQDQMSLLLLCDFGLSMSNESLTGQCLEIYVRLQDNFNDLTLYQEIAYASSPYGPYSPKPREKCPVCDELVRAIADTTLAQCDAGHFWGKKKSLRIFYFFFWIINQIFYIFYFLIRTVQYNSKSFVFTPYKKMLQLWREKFTEK